MNVIVSVLQVLNELSPLGVIGLLALIIWYQIKNQQKVDDHFNAVRTNDLHELPDVVQTLQRIEVAITGLDAFVRAKLSNGGVK